jgi:effector-binding domain-containing protein
MADVTAEIVELAPQEAVTVRGDVAIAELPEFFERAFHEAAEAASASGVDVIGPPFGYYPEMPAETVAVEAGYPVSAPVETRGNAHRFVLPGGRAVRAIHVGPYETLDKTYDGLQSWMADRVSDRQSGCGSATSPTPRSNATQPRGGRGSSGRSVDV